MVMEYEYFALLVAQNLPESLSRETDFKQFLTENSKMVSNQISDFVMVTLPSPRVDFYSSSDYFQTQKEVTSVMN